MAKDIVVILSGIVELVLGLMMVFCTKLKAKVGLALAIFYILIFPGNIVQYVNGIDVFGLDAEYKAFDSFVLPICPCCLGFVEYQCKSIFLLEKILRNPE